MFWVMFKQQSLVMWLSMMALISEYMAGIKSTSCTITLIGSGKNDPDPNQFEASVLLNGEYIFYRPYKSRTEIARGIHLGLFNVTSCELIETPQQFDTYGSSSYNQDMADFIDAFPTSDTEVMLVGVTGDNYGKNMNNIGEAALAKLGIPGNWLYNDRTSFVVFGRPGCTEVISDYRPSGEGPVMISVHFDASSSPSGGACAIACMNDAGCSSFSQTSAICTLFSVPGQNYNHSTRIMYAKPKNCKPSMWYSRY